MRIFYFFLIIKESERYQYRDYLMKRTKCNKNRKGIRCKLIWNKDFDNYKKEQAFNGLIRYNENNTRHNPAQEQFLVYNRFSIIPKSLKRDYKPKHNKVKVYNLQTKFKRFNLDQKIWQIHIV